MLRLEPDKIHVYAHVNNLWPASKLTVVTSLGDGILVFRGLMN